MDGLRRTMILLSRMLMAVFVIQLILVIKFLKRSYLGKQGYLQSFVFMIADIRMQHGYSKKM